MNFFVSLQGLGYQGCIVISWRSRTMWGREDLGLLQGSVPESVWHETRNQEGFYSG